MEVLKQCKTCEFNFSGICAGHGNTYKYGEAISDDTLSCDDWSVGFDYFAEITKNAPWYIREPYRDSRIDYSTFEKLFEADAAGEAIEVNIFDAIRTIYGLSLVDLAVLLNEFFKKMTTHDFEQLRKCKAKFEESINVETVLKNTPEWKQKLINQVVNTLHCPIHFAKVIARIDKLNWEKDDSDALNNSEKLLVDYISKAASKNRQTLISLEYSLDIAALSHIRTTYLNNE